MTIDLDVAHTSKEVIARTASEFLIAHKFSDTGKAGQDAINHTTTVLNFSGANNLIVSIYLNRKGIVLISFDQNLAQFSSESQALFDQLKLVLEKKWPGSVTIDSRADKMTEL